MIDATLQDIESLIDRAFEKQARFINIAFQDMKDHLDSLDGRLETVEYKLDRALYTDLAHLDKRIKVLEIKNSV